MNKQLKPLNLQSMLWDFSIRSQLKPLGSSWSPLNLSISCCDKSQGSKLCPFWAPTRSKSVAMRLTRTPLSHVGTADCEVSFSPIHRCQLAFTGFNQQPVLLCWAFCWWFCDTEKRHSFQTAWQGSSQLAIHHATWAVFRMHQQERGVQYLLVHVPFQLELLDELPTMMDTCMQAHVVRVQPFSSILVAFTWMAKPASSLTCSSSFAAKEGSPLWLCIHAASERICRNHLLPWLTSGYCLERSQKGFSSPAFYCRCLTSATKNVKKHLPPHRPKLGLRWTRTAKAS